MANTRYCAAELMIYFEKHQFLEVLRVLIVRIGMDRPLCVKHYLRKNLRKIANSVMTKNTIVHLHSECDVEQFVKACLNIYNIPVITYNTRGKKVDARKLNEILQKFQKFCRQNGLYKKHKIYLNIPNSFKEFIQIDNCESPPTNFVHVTAGDQVNPDFKDVLDFYKCKLKKVPDQYAEGTEDFEERGIPEIMYKIKYSPKTVSYDMDANFVYRIAFIGRRGSGRKTQAQLLAQRYNLIYINIHLLIQQTLESKDNLAKVLCVSFKKEQKFTSSAIMAVLWRRLLQRDTLLRGWVIVGFPSCLAELKNFVENFQTPPNRFVVMHCKKSVALRRLIRVWKENPTERIIKMNTCAYVDKEHAQFDEKIKDMYEYLKTCKTKTIHIDGACSVCYNRTKILALCQR